MRPRLLATSKRSIATAAGRWRQVIAEKNPTVNALIYTAPPPDKPITDLPLSGVAVAVKDNITTADSPTSCSSAILDGFVSPFDATVVKLLREAGADIIGKTNCDEFGMGSLNKHSHYGPTINPFQHPAAKTPWSEREKRYAGGSSGGSAAAVAAGMCHVALGTDTGGSVRLPASYCGVAGFKPSYGLISRWGVVSYADSLDCVGILASRVHSIKMIYRLVSVHDPRDPTSASPEVRASLSRVLIPPWDESLHGLRIGIPQEYFPSELSPSIIEPLRKVVKALQRRGASVVPVSLPSTSYALSSYYVLASAEASSNLARYDGIQYGLHIRPPPRSDLTKTSRNYALSRSKGFGSEVKKRILLGTYALTADAFDNYFLQAQRVRQVVKNDFDCVFSLPNLYFHGPDASAPSLPNDKEGVDVLIHPSAIRTAPLIETEKTLESGSSLDTYVQDVLTVPASLAGLPALNVPIPEEFLDPSGDGWPIGVSVVGQWGNDELVMRVGEVVQSLK